MKRGAIHSRLVGQQVCESAWLSPRSTTGWMAPTRDIYFLTVLEARRGAGSGWFC